MKACDILDNFPFYEMFFMLEFEIILEENWKKFPKNDSMFCHSFEYDILALVSTLSRFVLLTFNPLFVFIFSIEAVLFYFYLVHKILVNFSRKKMVTCENCGSG